MPGTVYPHAFRPTVLGQCKHTIASLEDLPDKDKRRSDLSPCYFLWVTRFSEFPKLTQKPLAKLALYSVFLAFLLPLLTNCCSSQCCCWAVRHVPRGPQSCIKSAVAFLWSTFFWLSLRENQSKVEIAAHSDTILAQA